MKIKRYLISQLHQFIPVVLGVYIAILAGNWNENRVRKAEQNEYLKNLEYEIESNKQKVQEALAYQDLILKSARQVREELPQQTLEAAFWKSGHWRIIPGWEGLKIPRLEDAVHQSGIMTNSLSGMEFTSIHTISQSYNQQNDLKIYVQRFILDNLTQLENETKTIEVLNKLEIWQDVMNIENELLKQYDETLSILKKVNS